MLQDLRPTQLAVVADATVIAWLKQMILFGIKKYLIYYIREQIKEYYFKGPHFFNAVDNINHNSSNYASITEYAEYLLSNVVLTNMCEIDILTSSNDIIIIRTCEDTLNEEI